MTDDKQAKSAVHYSLGGDHCGACRYFIEQVPSEAGTCQKVAGTIDEDYWCRLFERGRGTVTASSAITSSKIRKK